MSTPAVGILKLIQDHQLRVFTTADIMTLTGLSPAAATQALRRLAKRGLTAKIKRGLWINRLIRNINPFEAVAHLAAPWPAYVSLFSALSEHGLVEEVPHVIYAASAGTPKIHRTSIGAFHIHHLPAHLIWGFELKKMGPGSFPLAEPEKAFLDLAYLALTPRSRLELPYKRDKQWNLNKGKLREYAMRFQFQPLVDYLKRNNLWG